MDKLVPNPSVELNILESFFESIKVIENLDSEISDSKYLRTAQSKLKNALRNVSQRCSCAKRSYGPCEVCQGSDNRLVVLRNFYRVIRNAKKRNMSAIEIKDFVENTQKRLISDSQS